MKQLTILLCLAFVILAGIDAQAQIKMPKTSDLSKNMNIPTNALTSELVKALNPGKGLGISTDQFSKLEGNNKSYVNDLVKIFSGSGTDAEKNTLAESKLKERKSFLKTLLGDGKVQKYYQLIKPQVEPLIKKYALAKFLM